MILFKLFHLAKTGRDAMRDPLRTGNELLGEVVTPVLFVPVLILGSISIVFGVLASIWHHWSLLFFFWLSVPFTLIWCAVYLMVMRLYKRATDRLSSTINQYAHRHGVDLHNLSGTQDPHIVDTGYTEE